MWTYSRHTSSLQQQVQSLSTVDKVLGSNDLYKTDQQQALGLNNLLVKVQISFSNQQPHRFNSASVRQSSKHLVVIGVSIKQLGVSATRKGYLGLQLSKNKLEPSSDTKFGKVQARMLHLNKLSNTWSSQFCPQLHILLFIGIFSA